MEGNERKHWGLELLSLQATVVRCAEGQHSINRRLSQLEAKLEYAQSLSDGEKILWLKQNDNKMEEKLQQLEGVITDRMASKVSKMIEVATEKEVQDLKQRIMVLEAQVAGHKGGVTTGLDPKEADLETGQESAKEAVPDPRHYTFQESVYDAMLLVFTKHAGNFSSLFVCAGFLVNLVLQLGVVMVLKDNFTSDELPDLFIDKLKQWRASEGHSYRNADMLTGVSLVSRICADDASLSISERQLSIRADAEVYLNNNQGMILCLIAIALWSFICALECRTSLEFFIALFHLPRSTGRSDIAGDANGFHMRSVHLGRLLLGGIVAFCRSVIAILLLVFGSWWLAYTTSINDLLLNASALGFVLDIDEILFQLLSPSSYLGLIDAMQPLILPRYDIEIPSACIASITAFVIVVELVLAGHTRTQLTSVQDVLCSESTNLDFITGITETGFLMYAESVPYDEGMTEVVKARQAATQLLIDRAPDVHRFARNVSSSYRDQNLALVKRESVRVAQDYVNVQHCVDSNDPNIGGLLWVATGVTAVKSVTTCAEVSGYCRGDRHSSLAKNVRMMCPITCGCADPLSGLWHLADAPSGCPWYQCRYILVNLVNEYGGIRYKCEDTPVTGLQSDPSWSSMLHGMRLTLVIDEIVFNNMSSHGCTAIQHLPWLNRTAVCGTFHNFFEMDQVMLGAGVMCPESCGCIYPYSEQPAYAPEGYVPYTPGDTGLCPMRSCWDKYVADYKQYQCANYGDC